MRHIGETDAGIAHAVDRKGIIDALLGGFGTQWVTQTLAFKPYPCGTMTHPYIDCARRLAAKVKADDINKWLTDPKAMATFLAPLGVDSAKFLELYNSFTVQTKCQQAAKLQDTYNIDGVPTVAVGGRFLTSPAMAGFGLRVSEEELGQRAIAVANFLIEQARKG